MRDLESCNKRCVECKRTDRCNSYLEFKCNKLDIYLFVCDGCNKIDNCPLDKQRYYPVDAENSYRKTLVESRKGIN